MISCFLGLNFESSSSSSSPFQVDEQVAELGVEVIRDARATIEGGTQLGASQRNNTILPTVGPCVVKAGGKTISADLVFSCIGGRMHSKVYQCYMRPGEYKMSQVLCPVLKSTFLYIHVYLYLYIYVSMYI